MIEIRTGLWWFGTTSWLWGISERTVAALSDGVLGAIDIGLLSVASFYFVCWLFLKPAK